MSNRLDGPASCRTIVVTQHCPPAMGKRDVWRVDHFHLLRKVGSGYASTVYLGTCRTTGNQVAVKLYHKNKLSELNHFQVAREITIHSGLDHKHIIQLWAAFEDQYGIYLVFEYASKGDVFTEVERRGGQLNEAEAVRQIIYPFLSALDYLHSNYIIHRDIKPENLLFTSTGVLKVGDFGLSINFSQERPVTRVGTLDYMAPEVVVCPDKHRPQDHKELKHLHYTPLIDAWAVGVLAYELIVGRPPFDKGQKKATIHEILNGEPFIPPWLSEGAIHFIKWALTKEQGKRPSVGQLAEHPWIVSHLKQTPLSSMRRHLVKTDSFVEPRQLGFRGSNAPMEPPSSSGKEPPRPLQVSSVVQGGRTLGHSNSMSAVDGMRFRDIHLDSITGGMATAAEAAITAVKRVSDGDGTTGGRPSAAGGRVSRAGTARNSGAGGLSRMGSLNAAAAAVADESPRVNRPTTREDLASTLSAPVSGRALVRSFTSGRIPAHQASAQHAPRTSGSGTGVAAGASTYITRGHAPGSSSPLVRNSSSHGPTPAPLLSTGSADLAAEVSRLRVEAGLTSSGGGAAHSPKPLRPQPPQAPSPASRGLKTGSPLIPSRLSQSFTTPTSPLAPTSSGQLLQPSRFGLHSNSDAVHADATASARNVQPQPSLSSPVDLVTGSSSQNSACPQNPHVVHATSSNAVCGSVSVVSQGSGQGAEAAPESPSGSEREDPIDRDSAAVACGKDPVRSRSLFGSFKKVFS